MKTLSQLSTKAEPTAVVYSILESVVPSTLEEMILRAGRKIASQEGKEHRVLIPENAIYTSPIIAGYISRFSSNVTTYKTFSEAKTLIKANKVVCSAATISEYKNPVGIKGANTIIESARQGDFGAFKSHCFLGLMDNDCKILINAIREELQLDPLYFNITYDKDELREKYFSGDIYNVGQVVESNGVQYEILHRGSNYLILVDSAGDTSRKWITDIHESAVDSIFEDVQLADQIYFKGYTTKSFDENEELRTATLKAISETTDPYSILLAIKYIDKYIELGGDKLEEKVKDVITDIGCVLEDLDSADYKTGKDGRKYLAKRIVFKNSNDKEEDKDAVKEGVIPSVAKVNKSKTNNASQDIMVDKDVARMKRTMKTGVDVTSQIKEEDETGVDISDDEIDSHINSMKDWEDVIGAYDDDEFTLVDEDGEELEKHESVDEQVLNEVLSRIERIRAKMRFAKTKAKRERAAQIALKKRSDTKTINKRARKLAIEVLKKKIVKKNLDTLSVAEKERVERTIEKSKKTIDRIAMKMVPKVRKIEAERLSHPKVTKDA